MSKSSLKMGTFRFCDHCGYSVAAHCWPRHLHSKTHAKCVKSGTWAMAMSAAADLRKDADFIDVREGWFTVNVKGREERATVVARDDLGNTTIMFPEGGFRQYLKGEIQSILKGYPFYERVELKSASF